MRCLKSLEKRNAEKFEEYLKNPPELSDSMMELMRRALEREAVNKPFEGVLGDTYELKVIEFLLPLEGLGFTVSELSNEIGLDRNVMFDIVERLKDWEIINKKYSGGMKYSLNANSSIVKAINYINNAIIAKMIEKETIVEISTKQDG